MTFDTALFVSAFATLFVIIDPPGNLPIFLALTSKASERNRRRIAFQANFIAGILLLLFGFFGFSVFNALGISAPALQLSGGLLLLLIALQLLTGQEQDPGSPMAICMWLWFRWVCHCWQALVPLWRSCC